MSIELNFNRFCPLKILKIFFIYERLIIIYPLIIKVFFDFTINSLYNSRLEWMQKLLNLIFDKKFKS